MLFTLVHTVVKMQLGCAAMFALTVRDCSKLVLCAAMFTLQRIEREIERLLQTDEISPIFLNEDSHFPPPVGQCVSWHKVKRKRRQLRTQKDYPTMKNITLLQKLTSLIGFQMFGKNPQR